MRDWNWEIVQMVRKFKSFRSEREKRTTSRGSPQFSNGFFGKLLFHLTFNRNFRIFWLNCKHPEFPFCYVMRNLSGRTIKALLHEAIFLTTCNATNVTLPILSREPTFPLVSTKNADSLSILRMFKNGPG